MSGVNVAFRTGEEGIEEAKGAGLIVATIAWRTVSCIESIRGVRIHLNLAIEGKRRAGIAATGEPPAVLREHIGRPHSRHRHVRHADIIKKKAGDPSVRSVQIATGGEIGMLEAQEMTGEGTAASGIFKVALLIKAKDGEKMTVMAAIAAEEMMMTQGRMKRRTSEEGKE